jgi:hypothetical protein
MSFLNFAVPCHAAFLTMAERMRDFEVSDLFLPDNEHFPQDALPALRHSKSGVYLAVGTERGFNNFAYSKATHLLLTDYNPAAVIYNRLTILLLKGAPDLATYRKLKMNRAHLIEQLNELNLTPKEIEEARNMAESEAYKAVTSANINNHWDLNRIWHLPVAGGAYDGANYAYDLIAFNKVQEAARLGRIQAELVDLSDLAEIENLVSQMQRAQLTFSVVDLSNAWEFHFIGPETMPAVLNKLAKASRPSSILLLTSFADRTSKGNRWRYLAAHFDQTVVGGSAFQINQIRDVETFAKFAGKCEARLSKKWGAHRNTR